MKISKQQYKKNFKLKLSCWMKNIIEDPSMQLNQHCKGFVDFCDMKVELETWKNIKLCNKKNTWQRKKKCLICV